MMTLRVFLLSAFLVVISGFANASGLVYASAYGVSQSDASRNAEAHWRNLFPNGTYYGISSCSVTQVGPPWTCTAHGQNSSNPPPAGVSVSVTGTHPTSQSIASSNALAAWNAQYGSVQGSVLQSLTCTAYGPQGSVMIWVCKATGTIPGQ